MEILSSHRSRHTLARRSAPPRSLARSIARDETNMSTFECTRKLPQHEYALVLFWLTTFIYLKHLYIFIEKGKKSFITIFKESPFSSVFPKLLLFPTIARHGPLVSNNLIPIRWYRCMKYSPLHFSFKTQLFPKLAHGQSRAFQLSISEDSAIRIVLHSAEVARFSHIHPATHRVRHVSPYRVYAK